MRYHEGVQLLRAAYPPLASKGAYRVVMTQLSPAKEWTHETPPVPKRGWFRRRDIWGLLALGLVTAIWGYCNILIRQTEAVMAPSVLLVLRYALVPVFGWPWLLRTKIPLQLWLKGLGVGMFLGTATWAQAMGMETVTVDQVAFITALYVIMVPVAIAVMKRRRPSWLVLAVALTSLLGVAILIGNFTLHLAMGTLWSFVAAVLATGQIIATAKVSRLMDTLELTVVETIGATLTLALGLALQAAYHPDVLRGFGDWSWVTWGRLGFLGLLGTLVACWLQIWGQSKISASEAALAFNVEPVWTAVFAWSILRQTLGWVQMTGALLILGSITVLARKPDQDD